MEDYFRRNLEPKMESSKLLMRSTYSVIDPKAEGDLKYKKLHILQRNTVRRAIHKASS